MSWILTASGRKFFPANPSIDAINIGDIGHALSNLCRFAGHTSRFYSVASHSRLVVQILNYWKQSPAIQLSGLLHDATEAYLVDVPAPIKQMECMAGYRELEYKVAELIEKKFHLLFPLDHPMVKKADIAALKLEAEYFMCNPKDWVSINAFDMDLKGLNAVDLLEKNYTECSRAGFVMLYHELVEQV